MKRNIIILCSLICGVALGQTNTFLTWEDCLRITEKNSPDLIKSRSVLRELEFGVASANAGFYPEIDASAQWGVGGSSDYMEFEKRDGDSSVGLSLRQDLFSGFRNVAQRNRSIIQLKIGQAQHREVLANSEEFLRLAFIEVIYAQKLVKLTEQIEERRHKNVRLIQLRFDGGREDAGSLARSKAQLSQAKYEVRQAQRSLSYALQYLASRMGKIEKQKGVIGELNATTPEKLNDAIELSQQTPSYLIAKLQVKSAQEGLRISRSSRFPSLRFSAGIGAGGDEYLDNWQKPSWSAGLNASVPIFRGGSLDADEAARKEDIVQTEMDLLEVENFLISFLVTSWNSYMNAVEYEAVQQELLEAEKLRAEISTEKYTQGLLSYEDWDVIENNLINQEKTYLQRRRASASAQARWKNALGHSVWLETGE